MGELSLLTKNNNPSALHRPACVQWSRFHFDLDQSKTIYSLIIYCLIFNKLETKHETKQCEIPSSDNSKPDSSAFKFNITSLLASEINIWKSLTFSKHFHTWKSLTFSKHFHTYLK